MNIPIIITFLNGHYMYFKLVCEMSSELKHDLSELSGGILANVSVC